MTDNEMESGFELVLDNRRLIAAFAVFLIICGSFFVLGYATGKRQGELAASSLTGTGQEGIFVPAPDAETADAAVPSMEADEVQKDLEWYQSVNDRERGAEAARVPEPPRPAEQKAAPATPYVSRVDAPKGTYTVQVGAFKTRGQAEAHAGNVRSKGFEPRIEAPASPDGLYLVKVGRFGTRAEATAAQLRLKKSGYNGFIKTN